MNESFNLKQPTNQPIKQTVFSPNVSIFPRAHIKLGKQTPTCLKIPLSEKVATYVLSTHGELVVSKLLAPLHPRAPQYSQSFSFFFLPPFFFFLSSSSFLLPFFIFLLPFQFFFNVFLLLVHD